MCLGGTVVFGLDAMGPPAGRLEKGQFGLGADYSFSNMDLIADGQAVYKWRSFSTGEIFVINSQEHSFIINGLDIHKAYADIGYGITTSHFITS